MTAPDAREGLREVLADALVRSGQLMFDGGRYRAADALLPVVTDYVEAQARARAAEELRKAATNIRQTTTLGHIAERLERRAAALAADDRTDSA